MNSKQNYVRHKAVGRTSIGLKGDQDPFAASDSESSVHHQGSEFALLESEDSSGNIQDELLVGCEGELLIPTAEEINKTYQKVQLSGGLFLRMPVLFHLAVFQLQV